MTLIAVKSGKPIVPLYIKKRKNIFQRLVFMVGEPIDVSAIYGSRPNQEQLAEITEKVHQVENDLKDICEERTKGRK